VEELKEKKKLTSKLIFYFIIFGIFSIISLALVSLILYKPTLNYKNLSKKDQSTLQNAIVSYKHVKVKFCDLYPNNSSAYDKLTSDHISLILKHKVFDLSDPYSHYLDKFLVHDWTNLTMELKHKILESNLTFQNEVVKFQEILNSFDPELSKNPFESLTSDEIKFILDGNRLKIGNAMENMTNYFIDRKFIGHLLVIIIYEF
jgi:hypothetical protein